MLKPEVVEGDSAVRARHAGHEQVETTISYGKSINPCLGAEAPSAGRPLTDRDGSTRWKINSSSPYIQVGSKVLLLCRSLLLTEDNYLGSIKIY